LHEIHDDLTILEVCRGERLLVNPPRSWDLEECQAQVIIRIGEYIYTYIYKERRGEHKICSVMRGRGNAYKSKKEGEETGQAYYIDERVG